MKNKSRWYYPRGLNSVEWRRKYFKKYREWIWDEDLLDTDISKVELILYMLYPIRTPFITFLFFSKKKQ